MSLAAFATAAALAGAATPHPTGSITTVEARLFYTDTGALSKNVLDSKGHFAGWNTVIGEGDSGGSANDVMIVVKVDVRPKSDSGTLLDGPLVITARTAKRLLGQRRITNVLVPYKGGSSQALYLSDVACAGRIFITATIGKSNRKAVLDMDCGE